MDIEWYKMVLTERLNLHLSWRKESFAEKWKGRSCIFNEFPMFVSSTSRQTIESAFEMIVDSIKSKTACEIGDRTKNPSTLWKMIHYFEKRTIDTKMNRLFHIGLISSQEPFIGSAWLTLKILHWWQLFWWNMIDLLISSITSIAGRPKTITNHVWQKAREIWKKNLLS